MSVVTALAATVVGTAVGAPPVGTPSASAMALTAADIPDGKVVKQAGVSDSDLNIADDYERSFEFATPHGTSKFVSLDNETLVATSSAAAANEYHGLAHRISQPSYLRALSNALVKRIGKKNVVSVALGKPHALAFADSAMEITVILRTKRSPLDISISVYRLASVLVFNLAEGIGGRVSPGDALAFGKLGVAHIKQVLVPLTITAPSVTGAPQQGQTLTAAHGTWGDEPTGFAYQWQHCDATGANCADVPGATAGTYAVTSADVGSTLKVVVTATNRFGAAAAPSAATAAAS